MEVHNNCLRRFQENSARFFLISFAILLISLILGCTAKKREQRVEETHVHPNLTGATLLPETDSVTGSNDAEIPGPKVGDTISLLAGHFERMDRNDTISIIKVKQGTDAENQDVYQIKFSSGEKSLNDAPYGGRLIDEGDLNGDSLHEFSVFADPFHGCTYGFITFTHKSGKWKHLFDEFLIPTACDPVSDSDLQSCVFSRGGVVYYRQEDFSDTNWPIVTKRAKLLDNKAK